MALEKFTIDIPLVEGIDTKDDPAQLPRTRLTALTNGTFTTPGKIKKRNGYSALSNTILGGGTISTGSSLMTRGNELLLANGNLLYSWDVANSGWVSKGNFIGTSISQNSVARPNYYVYGQDCAQHSNGIQCFVWEQWSAPGSGLQGVFYSMVDSSTGQIVKTGTIDANGCAPKVITVGSQFAVIYINGTADPQHLKGKYLDATAPLNTPTGTTQLDTGAGNDKLAHNAVISTLCGLYDACVIGSTLYIAFRNDNNGVTVYSYSSGSLFTQVASRATAGALNIVNVGIFGDQYQSGPVILYSTTTPTVNFAAYNGALNSTLGSGQIDTTLSGTLVACQLCGISTSNSNLSLTVFYSYFQPDGAAVTQNSVIKIATISGAYVVGGVAILARSVSIAGKPLSQGSAAYIPASYATTYPGDVFYANTFKNLQPTCFLINTLGVVVAKWLYGLNGGPYFNAMANYNTAATKGTMLPETISIGSSSFLVPSTVTDLVVVSSGRIYSQTGLNAITITFGVTGYRAELANTLHMGGGVLNMYDGDKVVEHNFYLYPDPISVSTNAAGGSIAAGTYQYVVCYTWMDAQGNIHRSAPSLPYSIATAGATSTNTVTIWTLRLTAKTSTTNPIITEVYRTLANGSIFYLASTPAFGTVFNSTTSDTVTFTDTQADTSISGNSQLCTTGGVLPNNQPGPSGHMCVHQNRLVVIDSTNPLQLYVSKQVIPTSTGVSYPVEFSQFLTLNIDPRGGAVTAVSSMDEKLVIFKSNLIFIVYGQGPDSTGRQSDWSDPICVATDIGCPNPKSLVLTSDGLLFHSNRGIYLLARNLTISYVGSSVESYNNPPMIAATIIPNTTAIGGRGTQQVRFVQQSSGVVPVYDSYVKNNKSIGQWSIFSLTAAPIDAVMWSNLYTYLTASGIVYQETSAYSDPSSTYIPMTITTGWVNLAGIQGYQRLYKILILADNIGSHILRVTLEYDYGIGGTTSDTRTFTSPVLGSVEQFRIFPSIQKCQAIKISIFDSVGSGGNLEGYALSNIALEVGVKKGLKKIPAVSSG